MALLRDGDGSSITDDEEKIGDKEGRWMITKYDYDYVVLEEYAGWTIRSGTTGDTGILHLAREEFYEAFYRPSIIGQNA